ncbi:hypothetical protein BX667DRAFT_537693 [Coemansia mojavensis]|nr:hypothetical protein BX667DRAFT_537693 [Coemansia mojavensis]
MKILDEESLFSEMECAGNIPEPLKKPALGMCKLLFPSQKIFKPAIHDDDPRAVSFTQEKWLAVFKEAAKLAQHASMPSLEKFYDYVNKASDLHISSTCHKVAAQPRETNDQAISYKL